MTLRWYHWLAIGGGALWFIQWRKALTLAPAASEAAGENVSGQSASPGGGFSQILGNLVSALTTPAPASSSPASSPASSTAANSSAASIPSLAPSPVVSSPLAFSPAPPPVSPSAYEPSINTAA